jgi:hypothetical protein
MEGHDPNRENQDSGAMTRQAQEREVASPKPGIGSLIFGAALITGGILLGLGRFGWLSMDSPAQLWPLALIGIGVNSLWQTWGSPDMGSGAWLILGGLWFLVVNLGVLGLTLKTTWPVVVMLSGLIIVWRSIVTSSRSANGKEAPNGR